VPRAISFAVRFVVSVLRTSQSTVVANGNLSRTRAVLIIVSEILAHSLLNTLQPSGPRATAIAILHSRIVRRDVENIVDESYDDMMYLEKGNMRYEPVMRR
jgi:hypothetical protein